MMPVSNHNFSYSACMQTDNSLATFVPQKKEEYYAIWSAWKKDPHQRVGEKRNIAVMKMRDCLDRNTNCLDLMDLNLSSLPNFLPKHIISLELEDNNLCRMPDNLPNNIEILGAVKNNITIFPENLTVLWLCHNKIENFQNTYLHLFYNYLLQTINWMAPLVNFPIILPI